MGCGEFIVKYLLFFANLFFALAGLTLLGVGIAVQLKLSAITSILEQYNVEVAPILAMVVGGIVFCIAFFGCCGAIRESNCMLVTYAIFMIILMIIKIALATLIFVNLSALLDEIPKILNEAFSNNPTNFQNTVETTFQCCGTIGASSYPTPVLPNTCCATPPCMALINVYDKGCNEKVSEFASTFGDVIAFFAIAVAAVELVTVVFALCLANTIRNKDRRARY